MGSRLAHRLDLKGETRRIIEIKIMMANLGPRSRFGAPGSFFVCSRRLLSVEWSRFAQSKT
jgi:hypothetical protein